MIPGLIAKIRSSLSSKTAVIVALPVLVITALFSYRNYVSERNMLFKSTELQLLRVAEVMASSAEALIGKRDADGLAALVQETAKSADIELITIISPRGRIIASNKAKWAGRSIEAMAPEDFTENDLAAVRKGLSGGYSIYYDPDDKQYCFVMPIEHGSAATGVLQISMDIGSLTKEINRIGTINIIFSLTASFLIGATVSLFRIKSQLSGYF